MLGFLGPIAAGIGGLVSTLGPSVLQYAGQNSANDANRDIARETSANNLAMSREATAASRAMATESFDRSQMAAREEMAFQREMSSTAYVRATQDMKNAGINPMLAYMQGGASTPPGAMGSSSPGQASQADAQSTRVENVFGGASATALDTARLIKELRSTDASVKLNEAQAEVAKAQKKLTDTNARTAQVQYPAVAAQAKVDKKTAEFDEGAVKYDSLSKRIKEFLGMGNSAKGLGKKGGLK